MADDDSLAYERVVMRSCWLFAPLIFGCATEGTAKQPDQDASLAVSGEFAGRYDVPIAPALSAAATYGVDEVEWTVVGDTATLHYDLPIGLVGGKLDVTLTGPIDHATQTVALSGTVGAGSCEIAGSVVTCREVFTDLGALPLSLAVVEHYARLEYRGSVEDRIRVATMFASEPIGIVAFDLEAPVVDDQGDNDDD